MEQSPVLAIIHDQLKGCADHYSTLEKVAAEWRVQAVESTRLSSVQEVVVPSESGLFTFENVAAHREAHRQLSSFRIREGSLEEVLQKHQQAFLNHPLLSAAHLVRERKAYFHSNWLLAAGNLLPESYVAVALHGLLAGVSRFAKIDSPQKMKWLYHALLLTSGVSTIEGLYGNSSFVLALGGIPLVLSAIGFETRKQRRRVERRFSSERKQYGFFFQRDYTPALERIGDALDAGYRSLRYINNVCTSERQSIKVYAGQIEKLESVLFTYLQDGREEALREFKVEYQRPASSTSGRSRQAPELSPVRKNGYSAAEYEQLRREREEADTDEQVSSGNYAEENIGEGAISSQQRSDGQKRLDVLLSSSLQEAYQRNDIQVDGIPFQVLVESSQEKIRSRPKHTLVRERGSHSRSKFVVQELRERYGLPDDARIFKLNTRQGVRCLYTMNDGTAMMLEVIDHREYDRLFGLKY